MGGIIDAPPTRRQRGLWLRPPRRAAVHDEFQDVDDGLTARALQEDDRSSDVWRGRHAGETVVVIRGDRSDEELRDDRAST
jgi:hypothetical protein